MEQDSLATVTALVVVVSAVLFIVETFLRRDDAAGRLWALGFLSGLVTTLFYLVWATQPASWWAVAGGNGAFVASTGLMWLGCRRYNEGSMRGPAAAVAVASAAAAAAALLEGPDGGDWAGALWMFVPLWVFAALAALATRRGTLRHAPTAAALTCAFAVQSTFYAGRVVAFVVAGPESALFETWFGTAAASILTIVLTITMVVGTSVLRAGRTGLRGRAAHDGEGSPFGIRSRAEFDAALAQAVLDARRHGEQIAVFVVRLEELDYIATAFGIELADELVAQGRDAVRRSTTALAVVGEQDDDLLAVMTTVRSSGEARRLGMAMYRELFDAFNAASGGVLPSLGVGIAVGSVRGQDADALLADARAAALRAASSVASAVLVAEPSA
ncbi:diguanylate cyclase [Microbacterium sp. zg.Y625]|uniref:diguanylate cyclase domain-containing protein n=1 Tax=Microbacterium jiangjiandongii TaxID=3049071 RepID=UPI00214B8C20|nr:MULTISPECIES: diguanylate cyclase [unclassified Microbacterium]MCR2792511.1 diguanylate cyclase [Microbacterium sp. zg.Y625]WIM26502.1 diguanylate cyclase [Microbacterium sp. zg-Y625]